MVLPGHGLGRVSRRPFVFRSVWHEARDPDEVCARWADPVAYPDWWVGARSVWLTGEGRGELVVRGLLPIS
ncbi:SRPBCC family protein [Kytococcus sp. Marseille-QA3725]